MTLCSGQLFAYVERGCEYPELVFCLHGLTKSHLDFHLLMNSSLANNHHFVACDLKGHGLSDVIVETYDYDALAAELLECITQFGKKEVTLIGYSWGADLAVVLASTYPDLVKRVILLDGGYIHYYGISVHNGVTVSAKQENLAEILPFPTQQIEILRRMMESAIPQYLPNVRCECHILYADQGLEGRERLMERHRARFAKLVPHAKIHTLQGVTHQNLLEEHSAQVIAILDEILNKQEESICNVGGDVQSGTTF